MIRKHQIDPKTGLCLDVKPPPDNLWAAARIAGLSTFTIYTPWEKDKLQALLINWVIVNDVLFTTATLPSTWGLLAWNWQDLLHALLNAYSTMLLYVANQLQQRWLEVAALLERAHSKISVSVNV